MDILLVAIIGCESRLVPVCGFLFFHAVKTKVHAGRGKESNDKKKRTKRIKK